MPMHAKQLVWRCRRGVRELDVLFGRFLDQIHPSLPAEEQLVFERLLEIQDPIIMDWLFGRSEPDDPELCSMIARLKMLSGL